MQHRLIRHILKGAQNLLLARRGFTQQRQSLVSMARQHNMIETRLAIRVTDNHLCCVAPDVRCGAVKQNFAAKIRQKARHIGLATALHRAPDRPLGQIEQAVVVIKPDE